MANNEGPSMNANPKVEINHLVRRNKIYFACSWFTSHETQLMNDAITELKKNPTVDWDSSYWALGKGNQYKDINVDDHPEMLADHEWIEHTFDNDTVAERAADICVFIWDDEYPDTGMAWELGFAFGMRKPCVFVTRKNSKEVRINLMITSADDYITVDQLASYDFNHIHTKYFDGIVF